jgi:hypothetical protein
MLSFTPSPTGSVTAPTGTGRAGARDRLLSLLSGKSSALANPSSIMSAGNRESRVAFGNKGTQKTVMHR